MCNDLIWFGGGGGSVNTGVLQIAGGVALDSTLRFVEDQNGTDSVMQLSTDSVTFGTGTLTPNGVLTVKGAGSNIASFRDSSNVEQSYITNAGSIITQAEVRADYYQANGSVGFYFNSKGNFTSPSDGVFTFFNLANNGFDRLQMGGTTSSYPAIAATNTPAALAAKDATGTNLIPFSAEDFTSANLSAGTLTTARPMQFGDKGTVTTGNDLGLDAQIAVEHNGAVYYIPCSTSLIT
jgi:hypothetical protein